MTLQNGALPVGAAGGPEHVRYTKPSANPMQFIFGLVSRIVTSAAQGLLASPSSNRARVVQHSIAPSDFFLCKLFNVGAGRDAQNTPQSEFSKGRFARMLSRSMKTGLFENRRTKMAAKRKLRENDLVRIVLADGSTDQQTLYTLTWLGEGPYKKRCCIRRAGDPLAGDREWDVSLLR